MHMTRTARVAERLAALDWEVTAGALDRDGFAVTPPLLDGATCQRLRELFDDDAQFRSTIDMAHHSFGEGRYRYFAYPLPALISTLRFALYPPLAQIANTWAERLGESTCWPETHEGLLADCRAAGQVRPTPLILRYGSGDYNCLHQDLYGEIHFPLQVIFMLSHPEKDFEGGELAIVEHRPRLQSRFAVISIPQGACAMIPVRDRPRATKRGWSRSQVRHGVSRVRAGERFTLGIIFHDAA